MQIRKAVWFIRTKLMKPFYGKLGKHSYIGPTLFIERRRGLLIGNNVRIYPNLRAELPTKSSFVEIKDNVSIGQNFHVVSYNKKLIIPEGTVISANVFISNVNHDYKKIGVDALKQNLVSKDTVIGEDCFIGYGAVILPGTRLGKQCIVGANAVVSGNFDDYSVIAGVPAKIKKNYNQSKGKWERTNV